ncbi:hypothetical protein [Nocardia camponoti]|uniref:hypothetical protein n=1 Tax=Nocardia camponoti TaxID=1616106 RepID=UPI001668D71B|nr:hypothetical protein [Nocardia camponoti]
MTSWPDVLDCQTSDVDLRPRILAELTTTAWSIAGRGWVAADANGGRGDLINRLHQAFAVIPDALELSA